MCLDSYSFSRTVLQYKKGGMISQGRLVKREGSFTGFEEGSYQDSRVLVLNLWVVPPTPAVVTHQIFCISNIYNS